MNIKGILSSLWSGIQDDDDDDNDCSLVSFSGNEGTNQEERVVETFLSKSNFNKRLRQKKELVRRRLFQASKKTEIRFVVEYDRNCPALITQERDEITRTLAHNDAKIGENLFVCNLEKFLALDLPLKRICLPKTSLYEEYVHQLLLDSGVEFLREHQTRDKLPGKVTPDFFFPQGVLINGKLCFWIEMKTRLHMYHSTKCRQTTMEIIDRYHHFLGFGCLFSESGFSKILDTGGKAIILNGLYPFFQN